jgi:hypothetical protein
MRGVDPDQFDAGAKIDFHEFPAVGQLARRVGRFRQPHAGARRRKPDHCTGIGYVHGDGFAGRQHHIGEKPLVAADQGRRNEGDGKAHEETLQILEQSFRGAA